MAGNLVWFKDLDDGRWLGVLELARSARLVVSSEDEALYQRAFCYASTRDAMVAGMEWDGDDHPPGAWFKELGTGTYGPGFLGGAA